MAKFYFVRHGQSTANAALIVADSTPVLTTNGIEQARRTGEELKHKNISCVLTSPYIRAQQTAEIIAGEIAIGINEILVVDELRERGLGECEGKPKDMENDKFFMFDTERGFESQNDLINRLQVAIDKIKKAFKETDGEVVVVGHSVSGFYLTQVAKGFSKFSEFDDYTHMNNADYIEIEIAE